MRENYDISELNPYYNRDGYPDVEEYKDERGADKTSRKQRCGDCY